MKFGTLNERIARNLVQLKILEPSGAGHMSELQFTGLMIQSSGCSDLACTRLAVGDKVGTRHPTVHREPGTG